MVYATKQNLPSIFEVTGALRAPTYSAATFRGAAEPPRLRDPHSFPDLGTCFPNFRVLTSSIEPELRADLPSLLHPVSVPPKQFLVNELAEHRPKDWKSFLLSSLERLPRREKLRRLPGDETLRDAMTPEAFLTERSIRGYIEVALEDTVMVKPTSPVDHIRKLFEMPFDIVQLHRDGILGSSFDEFTKTNAHDGIILKPRGANWSKEAEAKAPQPRELSRNDKCYARLADCFDVWDASKSGLLEIDELAGAMEGVSMWPKLQAIVGRERLDKYELTALFRQLWADDPIEARESTLEKLEPAVKLFAYEYPFRQKVAALFNLLDKDRSQAVSVAEIKPLLTALGSDLLNVSQVVFEAIDTDASGQIGLLEFEKFMRELFGGNVDEKATDSLALLISRIMAQKESGSESFVAKTDDLVIVGEVDIKLNALFGACDKDKSGFVEEGELQRMFADMGADWDRAAAHFGLKGGSDKMANNTFRAVMKWVWGDLKEGVAWAATKALEVLQQRAEAGIDAEVANIKISDAIRPDELMSDLRELFQLWDADKSGFIDGAELRVILQDAALGEGVDAIDDAAHLGEDAFVGFIKDLWADKTEAFAGMAVHALRRRMLGNDASAEMEKTGQKESSVAEALFGVSEVKQRIMSVCDRLIKLHAKASADDDAASSSLSMEHARELLGSLRKLPFGELWGTVEDKLPEAPSESRLTSEEFYLLVKPELDQAEEASWASSVSLLDNRVRGMEDSAAAEARKEVAVLRELFLLFDKDDSGALSIAELAEAMNAAGIEGDATWENAGNSSFDLFAEEEEEAKEMTAEEFVDFLVTKWGDEALQKAETLLAGAKLQAAK